MPALRIATRGSALALIQARMVAERIQALGRDVELVTVKTLGDRVTDRSLSTIGGDGVFVKELEARLLDGSVEVAVHSVKDMPTDPRPALAEAAVLERDDPRDVLVSGGEACASIAALPPGAVVGTSSLRRRALLKLVRPDVDVRDIRGNVETRVRKVLEGEYAAAVLSLAGLRRAGLLDRLTGAAALPIEEMVPAPGQGAICAQCRVDDDATRSLLAQIDHAPTRASVTIERALLRRMGGGCLVPIGAHATVDASGRYALTAIVAATDGAACVRKTAAGLLSDAVPATLAGERLADEMLEAGGRALVERYRAALARER